MQFNWSAPVFTGGVQTLVAQCYLSTTPAPTPTPTVTPTPIPIAVCPQSDPFNDGMPIPNFWNYTDINPVVASVAPSEAGSLTMTSQSMGILAVLLYARPPDSDRFRYIFQGVNSDF